VLNLVSSGSGFTSHSFYLSAPGVREIAGIDQVPVSGKYIFKLLIMDLFVNILGRSSDTLVSTYNDGNIDVATRLVKESLIIGFHKIDDIITAIRTNDIRIIRNQLDKLALELLDRRVPSQDPGPAKHEDRITMLQEHVGRVDYGALADIFNTLKPLTYDIENKALTALRELHYRANQKAYTLTDQDIAILQQATAAVDRFVDASNALVSENDTMVSGQTDWPKTVYDIELLDDNRKAEIFFILINKIFADFKEIDHTEYHIYKHWMGPVINLVTIAEDLLWDDSEWDERGTPAGWYQDAEKMIYDYMQIDAMQPGGLLRVYQSAVPDMDADDPSYQVTAAWIKQIEASIHHLFDSYLKEKLKPQMAIINDAVNGREQDQQKVIQAGRMINADHDTFNNLVSWLPFLRSFVIDKQTGWIDFNASIRATLNKCYFFGNNKADGYSNLAHLLGKKGANLAEMARLGLPVPPGFTLPVGTPAQFDGFAMDASRKHMVQRGVKEIQERFNEAFGIDRRFADRDNPLLLSVRAGAEKSSPGRYMTLTKIGLHRRTVDGYGAQINDMRRAWYDYGQYIIEYTRTVTRHFHNFNDEFISILAVMEQELSEKPFHDLSLEQLRSMAQKFENLFEKNTGSPFPNPYQQVYETIQAVFENYKSQPKWSKSVGYKYEGFGINVQVYVYGAIDDGQSGTGVIFSRNPYNGERKPFGEVLFDAEGKELVTPYVLDPYGIDSVRSVQNWQAPEGLERLKKQVPAVHQELIAYAHLLEKHFREIQDIEFTFEKGRLFMLQTRGNVDYTTPLAKARILIDMAQEGLIDNSQAIEQVDMPELEWLKTYFESSVIRQEARSKAIARGMPLFPGIGIGPICIGLENASPSSIVLDQYALERLKTLGAFDEAIMEVNGIVTAEGSLADHAAVTLRGSGIHIPYVTGVEGLVIIGPGTARIHELVLQAGNMITIDGNTGYIYPELPSDDFELSEVAQVNAGILGPEDSRLYPYYKKVIEWISILKQKESLNTEKTDIDNAGIDVSRSQ
ncbi:MAG: hypothetical protein GF384_08090, partial [Elusimicrobia bacterium]|nr:hypothetical protein [Elusimicrobiota bacterium]MBD3412592.1 hypothetical protein [Elusimicrobiota bacterium]